MTYFGLSVIESDPKNEANFKIRLDQPNLESLDIPSTVKILHILGSHDIDSTKSAALLLKVSLLLQDSIAIQSILFIDCRMVEIAQFVFLATRAKKRDSQLLLAMEFENCVIQHGAASSLQFLLENDLMGDLGFMDCSFDDNTGDIIATGLRANQSLGRFALDWQDHEPPASLIKGVYGMLRTHKSISSVGLNMKNQSLWDLHEAIKNVTTLTSLEISRTTLEREDFGAISLSCLNLEALTTLSLWNCKLSSSGLMLFSDELSKHVELHWLGFIRCRIKPVADSRLELSWGGLKTGSLMLTGTKLGKDATSKMIDDIAANSFVKRIDLRDMLLTDDDFDKMCNVFLRQNGSPSDLMLGSIGPRGQMIVRALEHNTSVKRLTIDGVETDELVAFTEGLSNVHGLRHLTIGHPQSNSSNVEYTKAFFETLENSLQRNTSLWGISLAAVDSNGEMAKPFMPMIDYYLAINRVGRNLLTTANIHEGVWPQILAASADKPDGIYFALTSKPDLMAPMRHHDIRREKSARRGQPRRSHRVKSKPINRPKRKRTSGG